MRYRSSISEEELVVITWDALDIGKKIEGEHFRDLYELYKRAIIYEVLLREKSRTTAAYHVEIVLLEVDKTEFVKGEIVICQTFGEKEYHG